MGGRVTSRSRGVMKSVTGRASEAASSGMSRCERMPASAPLPFASSIRKLLALCLRMAWRASAMVAARGRARAAARSRRSGASSRSARARPARRSRQLRWRKPIPPSRARVLAISSPTTVSMLAPSTGRARSRPATSGIARPTSRRVRTGLCCGRKRKSSNVRPDEERLELAHGAIVPQRHGGRCGGAAPRCRLRAPGGGARRGARASTSPRGRGAARSTRARRRCLPVEAGGEPLVPRLAARRSRAAAPRRAATGRPMPRA